ncbi:hypothetical protein KPL47_18935 [Clostridium estertheticum]|uniref:hypothetical protein n=1 Tax=Clostridium estertheticum TaxID=238834 RepID=UPI001C0CC691|nr:hypothetical protein [Clostridium estertheticum]MBU3178402.1 hypothetical protein [Clostridium estertheticum]
MIRWSKLNRLAHFELVTHIKNNYYDGTICDAKIKLAKELSNYDKGKNNEQIKSLVDFLEYLFLIGDPKLEKIYEEYKKKNGGAFKLSIDEIRKLHYKEVGREEGREEEKIKVRIEIANEMLLDGESLEKIKKYSKLREEEITKLKNKLFPN